MLPEIWHSIHRLLFVADDDAASAIVDLMPVLQTVQTALQATTEIKAIALLKVRPQAFEFCNLSFERTSSDALTLPRTRLETTNFAQPFDPTHYLNLIQALRDRQFNAAVILTTRARSPFVLAYLCYLAGIPIRIGQSQEFGGSVLSHCIAPPVDPVSPTQDYLHLLRSSGLAIETAI